MPSLSSFLPIAKPGNWRSTRKLVMPLYPFAGSTVAITMKSSASAAFVIQSLRPVSSKWSPLSVARQASANASEPEPASDSA